jgi:putative N6-adenine-specific DNA methylase
LGDLAAQKIDAETLVRLTVNAVEAAPFEKQAPLFNPDSEHAITLVPFIRDGLCTLGIDSAGRALHKRGWRTTGHPAVLKETLAASILMMAGYDGSEVLYDPMCGSGTLVIEAAYIALNKAPLIHRGKDDFALEHLAKFDRALWRKISDQLRAQKKNALQAPIFASDINPKFVEVAKSSALKARVEKYLQFTSGSFQQLPPPAPKGLLVTNLPYGERIGSGEIERLYHDVGKKLAQDYAGWRVALLVPPMAPIKLLGLPRSQVHPLYNGALDVQLMVCPARI